MDSCIVDTYIYESIYIIIYIIYVCHNYDVDSEKNANWHVGSNQCSYNFHGSTGFQVSLVYFLRFEDMEPFIDYITSISSVFCVNQPQKQHQNTPSKSTIKPTPTLKIPETLAFFLGPSWTFTSLTSPPSPIWAPRNVLQKDPRPRHGTILQIQSLDLRKLQKNDPPGKGTTLPETNRFLSTWKLMVGRLVGRPIMCCVEAIPFEKYARQFWIISSR